MDTFPLPHAMKNSAKHLTLAILTVVLVVVWGRANPSTAQSSVLDVSEVATAHLTLSIPEQSETIGISSQAEVLLFNLEAGAPYTLRYLTLVVDSKGLNLPENPGDWKLYLVEDERINTSALVGYGEVFKEGLLRLRLFSDPAGGFNGPADVQSFALIAPLFKNGEEEPSLALTFPLYLPEELDWEFVESEAMGSWMNVDAGSILGAEFVEGLPSETLRKE